MKYEAYIKTGLNLVILVVLFVGIYFFPWKMIQWGTVGLNPGKTITVTGVGKEQKSNEIASFNAGVNAVNGDKEKAISEVNGKTEALIKAVKEFGIKEADIKTQNLSIYQTQETYYEDGVSKQRMGQWNVSNSIEITLREVKKVQDLSAVLYASGANNVYGPNFSLDTDSEANNSLYEAAIKDATAKAEVIARASNLKLGKVLSVNAANDSSSSPMYSLMRDGMGGGGGAPVEVGSTTVNKSLVVVFEVK